MRLLLDTHVWLWSVLEPERLAPQARTVLEEGSSALHVSAITSWELAMLVRSGRFDLGGDTASWIELAHREQPVVDIPIDRDIAVEAGALDWAHRDPADRFLAATARRRDLVLLTRDARLLEWDGVATMAA